jgi:hypothetical protein
MIAEAPTIAQPQTQAEATHVHQPSISIARVVAGLQVLLATRRAVHNEDPAYWYTVARGM